MESHSAWPYSPDMGLIAQNMKCEIPSLIKLTAQKRTVKYLTLVSVGWVVENVSCLSVKRSGAGKECLIKRVKHDFSLVLLTVSVWFLPL